MPPEFSGAAHKAAERAILKGLEQGWSISAIASNALDAASQQRKLEQPAICPDCGKTEWIEDTDLGQIKRCCLSAESEDRKDA